MPAEYQITAFLDNEDSPDIMNPIHSTAVAATYGYKAPLVGGVTVYGWGARPIMAVLGDAWLEDGWVDVSFRRPVFPGDVLTISATEEGDGARLAWTNQAGAACIEGTAGRGAAPWLGEIAVPGRRRAEPASETLPHLTMENAPIGEELRPCAFPYPMSEAEEYARDHQRDHNPPWVGEGARIHPGWLAGRMTRFLHHNYEYGPSIHASSQIQHLAPLLAGQTITVAGSIEQVYERKGHHYAIVDGLVLDEGGREIGRMRHTTAFHLARRD